VMGHSRCGAVTTAVDLDFSGLDVNEATGCDHLDLIVHDIQKSIGPTEKLAFANASVEQRRAIVDQVARKNVIRSVQLIAQESATISRLLEEGKTAIVGAMYDVVTGDIEFLTENAIGL